MPNEDAPQIELPDVTICAADSAFVELTARALKLSMSQCRFGDAILFSDVTVEGPFRNVRIEPLNSKEDYSRFCLRQMADFITTPFALVVQWDGYVVNAQAWASTFGKYDYIGAAWHGMFPPGVPVVGNGGFSLRSRKLLKAVQQLPAVGGHLEDRVICHIHGPRLEREFGIRFAPVKIADRFSYEFRIPETVPFGFHGIDHMWRHASVREFSEVAEKMDIERMDPDTTLRLIQNCATNGHLDAARSLYRRFRKRRGPLLIERELSKKVGSDAAAEEVRNLELLVFE